MITTEHTPKITGESLKNYISYFQSVTTIGIINRAKNQKEAESKARQKLDNSDFMCGVVGQSSFELETTDEWKPILASSNDIETPENATIEVLNKSNPIILNIDDNTKRCIAEKLNKDISALTKEDCSTFVKWCLEDNLE